jgi:apolipoprotein N-acyltransferase
MLGDYVPGDRYTIFPLEQTHFGAVICWELIFPELVREFVRRGARFMVIATNEAWFGETAAPYQLLAMSVFRAVENRVAIVRAANTGISAFIDPFGRITERLQSADLRELFVEGVLTSEVPLAEGQTWYTRHGDMFAFLQILWCVGLFYAAWRGARNRSR